MITFHRTYRAKGDRLQFVVLLDKAERKAWLARWDASDDRIVRLQEERLVVVAGTDADQCRQVRELKQTARYLAGHPQLTLVEAREDVHARKTADRQVISRRMDARAGDCAACGTPLSGHFAADNTKLTCAQALAHAVPR